MPNNIIFQKPDDPESASSLRQALDSLGGLPILGLLVKTTRSDDGQEQITNWRFADANTVKSLALILPKEDKE